ncbi:protein disulfide-isomerase A6 [Pelomyxa schiedti]|nr:protein disulfide-isomerase A6 [Pelomyxa schiedti]
MYKCLVVVAVLCALAFADEAVVDSKVIKLTTADFAEKTKEGVWMVKFFAPWCGHCKKLAPTWEEYAKLAEGIYNVAEVDATQEKDLATQFGVRGYPTLKLFVNGEVSAVEGPRTIKAWVDLVESKVPEMKGKIIAPPAPAAPEKPKEAPKKEVPKKEAPKKEEEKPRGPTDVVILDGATFDEKIKDGVWFVKFYAPWCGHCKKLAPIWEELATLQKTEGSFHVAEVDATVETALATKYAVRGYPTLLLFKAGVPEPIKYQGERTTAAFTAWVKGQITPPAQPSEL